jgi:hypothetical protein
VKIKNRAPIFNNSLSATSFDIMVNTTKYLELPAYNDPDGHTVTVNHSPLPSFVTYDSSSKKFTFSPKTRDEYNSGQK